LAGAGLVGAQHVPAASTHPIALPFPKIDSASSLPIAQPGAVRVGSSALIQTSDGSIMVPLAGLTLMIEPILTFSSRSADGCPVVLVGANERAGPVPRFREGWRDGKRSSSVIYNLAGQGPSFLAVRAASEGTSVFVDAVTKLDRVVYSHLNSF